MDTLEAIIIAILFLIPGFLVNKLSARLFPKTIKERDEFDKTVSCLILSIVVMLANIICIKIFFRNIEIDTITSLQDKLGQINFLMKYLILTFLMCLIIAFLDEYVFSRISLYLHNKHRKINKLPKECNSVTIWDEIFENKDIDLTDVYISIEKDGEVISQGTIKLYSPPNFESKELLLVYTNDIKDILAEDETKIEEEKLFNEIQMEYYNFEAGVLVKFYDMSKYNEAISRMQVQNNPV